MGQGRVGADTPARPVLRISYTKTIPRCCTNRCTRTSLPCPIPPTVADYRTSNLLILRRPVGEGAPVTAEVASSSLVVPAIFPITYRPAPNGSGYLRGQLTPNAGSTYGTSSEETLIEARSAWVTSRQASDRLDLVRNNLDFPELLRSLGRQCFYDSNVLEQLLLKAVPLL